MRSEVCNSKISDVKVLNKLLSCLVTKLHPYIRPTSFYPSPVSHPTPHHPLGDSVLHRHPWHQCPDDDADDVEFDQDGKPKWEDENHEIDIGDISIPDDDDAVFDRDSGTLIRVFW